MSHTKSKIIIELWGIPGVGKTTLAKKFADEHGYYHITAAGVGRIEYLSLLFRYPVAVLLWLRLILKNYLEIKSIKYFRYNISLLFLSLKKIRLAQVSEDRFIVIDEGLVQRFLSYSDVILTEKEIRKVVRVSPLGTTLVLVNDREVIKDRYDEAHDRGSLGSERLRLWRKNMTQNLQTIKGILLNDQEISHFETNENSIDDILQLTNKKPNSARSV